jgi:hypothetical protein
MITRRVSLLAKLSKYLLSAIVYADQENKVFNQSPNF